MRNVKNLKVNKRKLTRKGIKLVTGVILVGILTGVGITGVNALMENYNERQKTTIVEYYGQESEEKKLLDYIDISDKLNKMDLEKYIINETLLDKYNISNELKSPNELNELIDKCNLINSFVSTKDIVKQAENIEIILNLIRQESLVNSYIYTSGYSLAHENITEATKKYAGEVFDLNENDIKFGSYEHAVTIENNDRAQYDIENKDIYIIDREINFSKKQNMIADGVGHMVNVDASDDKNYDDNDEYNKDRNKYIKDALKYSVDLYEDVENKDLYDEDLASHFRK